MTVCGRCGHDKDRHWWGRAHCDEASPSALGLYPCTCDRYVSLGALIGVRVLVVLVCVAVLATFEGLLGGAPS